MKAALAALLVLCATAIAEYRDVAGSTPPDNRSISNLNVYGVITQKKTTWDDLCAQMQVSDIGGLTKVTYNEASNCYDFATTCTTNLSDDHMDATAEFFHGYATNTPGHAHAHYIQRDASQSNNLWFVRYRYEPIGQPIGPWIDVGFNSNEFAYASGSIHQYGEFLTIPLPSNNTVSTLIDIGIWRNGSVGAGPASLRMIGVHVEKALTGSPTEMSY